MAEQSAFDRNHIETSAVSETSGILDELNLPPKLTTFLRVNRRILWVIVSLVAVVVVTGALYNSYREYKSDQALSALDIAKSSDGAKRVELLKAIVDNYGSTTSGLWARVALSQEAVQKKNYSQAIAELQGVKAALSVDSPLKPLVLYKLGGLEEQQKNWDAAIELYQELLPFSTFVADAHYAMGRVYVAQGEKPEAVAQYRQYLSSTEKMAGAGSSDPVRQRVEYIIKQLQ